MRNSRKPTAIPVDLDSAAIDAARVNFYRPPILQVVRGAYLLYDAHILYGADPLKVARRWGWEPVAAAVVPGRVGRNPKPDTIVLDVEPGRTKRRRGR